MMWVIMRKMMKLLQKPYNQPRPLGSMKQKTKPKGIERIYYFNRVIVCERK